MRTPIVGGNWKMHTDRDAARTLLAALRPQLDGLAGVEVVICPPAAWLGDAADALGGSTLLVGAQQIHPAAEGAFTGEISAPMLAGTVDYVIVGHSERRHVFGETDEETAQRLRAVLDAGLRPILAVGELQHEREADETEAVLRRQLRTALEGIEDASTLVIAYEPVWAIGTGLAATPEIAQETCASIRRILGELFGDEAAESTRIQYGGSVNAGNIAGFAAQPDIDGALVGGASLDAEAFGAICRTVAGVV
jgi:triosephosphate isomerase